MELSGLNILVTRPKPQCEQLSLLIKKCGGYAIPLPLIKIEIISSAPPENIISKKAQYSGIIFVSKIAATLGVSLAKQYPLANIYAVGPGTAKVLAKHGIISEFVNDARSEILAELNSLKNISGQSLLIVKGEGGRPYLQKVLENRGGIVKNIDLYRRKSLIYPNNQLNNIVLNEKINIAVVTSEQILKSLLYQINYRYLKEIKFIVPSHRIMEIALKQGCSGVICSKGSDNDSILSCLAKLRKALVMNAQLKISG